MNTLIPDPQGQECLGGIFRILLSTNPMFGTFLRAYDEFIAYQQRKYIAEVLDKIGCRLENLERKEVFSEADIQVIILLLEKIKIEHNANKRIRFAHILESAFVKESTLSYDQQRRFTDATDRFSDTHIRILKLLYESPEPIATKCLKDELDLPIREEILPALNLLCGDFGFVRRQWDEGGALLSTTNLSPEGIAIKCECEITALGKQYLTTIKCDQIKDA